MTWLSDLAAWWAAPWRLAEQIDELEVRQLRLEQHMAQIDDALSALDEATNDIAAELDQLKSQVAGFDSNAAQRIQAAADRLRSLAADPANPVPDQPPAGDEPVDGGGTPVDAA